jgi:hypothetical protein
MPVWFFFVPKNRPTEVQKINKGPKMTVWEKISFIMLQEVVHMFTSAL